MGLIFECIITALEAIAGLILIAIIITGAMAGVYWTLRLMRNYTIKKMKW